MARPERFTTEEVAAALRKARGFVSVAARHLGCQEATVRRYIENYATVKLAQREAREEMKDIAEGKLFANISKGDNTAIIFFLKTQAKDRGYIERSEVVTEHKWIVEIGELLRQGKVTPKEVEEELGRDLAKELFESVGVPAASSRET